MPNPTRAAVFSAPGQPLELRRFDTPTPAVGETLVRVTHATICGSDLHSFSGRRQVATPTILGHEIVGRIEALGSSDIVDLRGQPLGEGDRVVWSVVASCGQCFFCQRDLPQKCQRAVKYGHEALVVGGELRGGLAERCLLARGTSIARVPDALSDEIACPASCATASVAASCEAAGPLRERSVLVVGAGLLGLTACAMAAAAGAERVFVCDPDATRLAQARRFAATDVCRPEQLSATVSSLTHQRGVDCVLEMSGSPRAIATALDSARIGGTIVLMGSVFPQPPEPVAAERLVRQHLTLRGVHNYAPRHLLAALEFLASQPAERFAEVTSQWFSLEEANAAFEAAAAKDRPLRVGVRP